MKKLLVPVSVFLLALFLFWYSGIDFDRRGEAQSLCVALSLLLAAFIVSCPGLPKDYQLIKWM